MIINAIHFAKIHEIYSYYPFPAGTIQVEAANWTPIPMHPASGEMTTSDSNNQPGKAHRTLISCRLRQSFSVPDACILKVELCNGDTFIIGSPDIPVQLTKNTTLYLETLAINYDSHQPPLKLIEI